MTDDRRQAKKDKKLTLALMARAIERAFDSGERERCLALANQWLSHHSLRLADVATPREAVEAVRQLRGTGGAITDAIFIASDRARRDALGGIIWPPEDAAELLEACDAIGAGDEVLLAIAVALMQDLLSTEAWKASIVAAVKAACNQAGSN